MSITGRIKTLFFDKNNSEAIFPRTKVKAISDDENRGLDFLLENIDTQLLNLQGQVNSKAPIGYGLGTEAQFISSNELLSDYSNTGFYRWSSDNIDPNKPFSSGEMLAIKRSDSYGQQIAFRADSLQPETKIRKKTDNKWSNWENLNSSSYGFGGKPVSLATGLLNNEVGLETALESVYSQMGSTETKLVRFAGYPSTSDYNWFGFLSKSSANYGSLVAYSAFARGACITKTKFNGAWEPLEWVNPPMVIGVEYRTTQRYNGKPVYVKAINFGALPVSGGSNISTGISSGSTLVKLTGTFVDTTSGSEMSYPIIDYEGPKCFCWVGTGCSPLCIQVNKDCSKYTGKFIIEYTKN